MAATGDYFALRNLHSNMDRLKLIANIYDKDLNNDLHSNMDRLKQNMQMHRVEAWEIYIPIWID